MVTLKFHACAGFQCQVDLVDTDDVNFHGGGGFDRRKFRSQTSDLWTHAATMVRAIREETELGEKKSDERQTKDTEEKKSEKRKNQKKAKARDKVVAKHCVFPIFHGSGGRQVGSLKRRV